MQAVAHLMNELGSYREQSNEASEPKSVAVHVQVIHVGNS